MDPNTYVPNTSTPPLPPPKPSDQNGQATPMRGPPLPPPPAQNRSNTPYGSQYSGQYAEHPSTAQVHPPPPGWLPDILLDKSTQDLHELLESPDLQSALLNNPDTSHPSVAASQAPLEQLLQSNISLATSLQQLESRLVSKRANTQSRLLSLRALEQQHRTKIAETENNLRMFSPMALYQQLNSSVQEQDALLKGIEDSFLEHGGPASDREVADFLRRVRDAKRTAFLRAERKERWDEGRVGGWR